MANQQPTPRLIELDERRLLPRHAAGDREAFGELLAAYRAPVFGYLVRAAVAPGSRDDLFQEIFLKIHNAAGAYQPNRPLRPWLFTIVANTVRSHFRKVTPKEVELADDGPAAPVDARASAEQALLAKDEVGWLETAIGDLSLPQREVLILTCIDGMDQNAVAVALQIPVNTVKTHLRRARLKLAEGLVARERGEGAVGDDQESR